MKIDRINSNRQKYTYFGTLDARKAQTLLMQRVNSPYKYERFNALKKILEDSCEKVELFTSENGKRLMGRVMHPSCAVRQESFFNYIFKRFPDDLLKELIEEVKYLSDINKGRIG